MGSGILGHLLIAKRQKEDETTFFIFHRFIAKIVSNEIANVAIDITRHWLITVTFNCELTNASKSTTDHQIKSYQNDENDYEHLRECC